MNRYFSKIETGRMKAASGKIGLDFDESGTLHVYSDEGVKTAVMKTGRKIVEMIISQSGTSAPVIHEILVNDIGINPVWSYEDVGKYCILFPNFDFTQYHVIFDIKIVGYTGVNPFRWIQLFDDGDGDRGILYLNSFSERDGDIRVPINSSIYYERLRFELIMND